MYDCCKTVSKEEYVSVRAVVVFLPEPVGFITYTTKSNIQETQFVYLWLETEIPELYSLVCFFESSMYLWCWYIWNDECSRPNTTLLTWIHICIIRYSEVAKKTASQALDAIAF